MSRFGNYGRRLFSTAAKQKKKHVSPLGSLSSKMRKAAVLKEHGSAFEISSIKMCEPSYDEVLVKIHSSGVCHTDIHAVDADWPIKSKLPLICGHEGVGEVVSLGKNVQNINIGDRVGIPWLHHACGQCEYCLTGRETICPDIKNTGYSVDGCFAEYSIAHSNYAARIPDALSYEQAAPILCAGVTTYKAIKVSQCKPGQYICIIGGAGGLGHLAIQYAKYMGLNVIAIDMGASKCEFCQSIGADIAFDTSKALYDEDENSKLIKNVIDASNGGVHACVLVATNRKAFHNAIHYSRNDGHVVFVGLPPGNVDLPIFETVLKDISIHGSIVGTRQDMNEALEIAANGNIVCNVESAKIEDINEVFTRVRKHDVHGRVVINF